MQTYLRGRDMITTQEWTKHELDTVLDVAFDLKRKRALGEQHADRLLLDPQHDRPDVFILAEMPELTNGFAGIGNQPLDFDDADLAGVPAVAQQQGPGNGPGPGPGTTPMNDMDPAATSAVITIDGPGGSGKGTIAARAASAASAARANPGHASSTTRVKVVRVFIYCLPFPTA